MWRIVFVVRTGGKDRGWERRWVEVRRRWRRLSLSIQGFWGRFLIFQIYLMISLSLWRCLRLFIRLSTRCTTCIKTRWRLKVLWTRLFCLVLFHLGGILNHLKVGKVLSRSIRNRECRFSILRLNSAKRCHLSQVKWGYTRRGWISWELWEIGRVCWRWVVRVRPDTDRWAEIATRIRFPWNLRQGKYRRRIWKHYMKVNFKKKSIYKNNTEEKGKKILLNTSKTKSLSGISVRRIVLNMKRKRNTVCKNSWKRKRYLHRSVSWSISGTVREIV